MFLINCSLQREGGRPKWGAMAQGLGCSLLEHFTCMRSGARAGTWGEKVCSPGTHHPQEHNTATGQGSSPDPQQRRWMRVRRQRQRVWDAAAGRALARVQQ